MVRGFITAIMAIAICIALHYLLGGAQSTTLFLRPNYIGIGASVLLAINVFIALGMMHHTFNEPFDGVTVFVCGVIGGALAGILFDIELHQILTGMGWDYRIDPWNFARDAGYAGMSVFAAYMLYDIVFAAPWREIRITDERSL